MYLFILYAIYSLFTSHFMSQVYLFKKKLQQMLKKILFCFPTPWVCVLSAKLIALSTTAIYLHYAPAYNLWQNLFPLNCLIEVVMYHRTSMCPARSPTGAVRGRNINIHSLYHSQKTDLTLFQGIKSYFAAKPQDAFVSKRWHQHYNVKLNFYCFVKAVKFLYFQN